MPLIAAITTGLTLYDQLSKAGGKDTRLKPAKDKYALYKDNPYPFLEFHIKDGQAFFSAEEIRAHFAQNYASTYKGSVGESVMEIATGYKGLAWDGQTFRDANLYGIDARGKSFAGKRDAISLETEAPGTIIEIGKVAQAGKNAVAGFNPLIIVAIVALFFFMRK